MNAVVPDVATRQRLSAVVPHIYGELTALDEHQLEVARQQLLGAPCVWVGDAFTVADRVALRSAYQNNPSSRVRSMLRLTNTSNLDWRCNTVLLRFDAEIRRDLEV
jgi:hypothetical protein